MSLLIGTRRALLRPVVPYATPGPVTYGVPVKLGYAEFEPDADVYSVPAADLGSAHADRWIGLSLSALSTGSTTTVSVTIGGVTATFIVQGASGNRDLCILEAQVPSGATGDIVVTRSGTTNRAGIEWFGYYSTQPSYSSRSGSAPTVNNSTSSLAADIGTVPPGGFGYVAVAVGTVGDVSWAQTSGVGVEFTDDAVGSSSLQFATYATTAAGAQSVTATGAAAANYRTAGFTRGP